MKNVPDHVNGHRAAQIPNPDMGSGGAKERCNLNTPDANI